MKEVNVRESSQEREQRIQQQWQQGNVFQQSVQNREGHPSFVFYEGPPTANGLPHVGHAIGRTIKDDVARYKTMTGHQVIRKAGWDTHGLPVELGVEKQLGISGKHDIE
ncbi:MAG: class I tRNA ligase family protein, partial [Priestia megaterium]